MAAIAFLEGCHRHQQHQVAAAQPQRRGGITAAAAGPYLLLLENALLPVAPSELAAAALDATLAVAAAQPSTFAAAYATDGTRQQLLLRLLSHVDAGARQAAAQLLGLLVPHLGGTKQQQQQQAVAGLCEALLGTLGADGANGAKRGKQEALEGAAAAAGYVAAHLIQGARHLTAGGLHVRTLL